MSAIRRPNPVFERTLNLSVVLLGLTALIAQLVKL